MQFVRNKTVPVHVVVYRNTLVIRTKDADQNAFSTLIVLLIKLVYEINAKIHVRVHADKTQCVRSLTIYLPARAFLDILEILSVIAL